jgi:heme b synthase
VFIDNVVSFSNPVLILTGGEPLLRPDILEIAAYATAQGLRVVMATNGTLIDATRARELKRSGIQRVSISLDGASAETHDRFRGVEGAFGGALEGLRYLREAGVEVQINTTVTQRNLHEIEKIYALATDLGAVAHHIFILVPTGRGRELIEEQVGAQDYERTLEWFYAESQHTPLQLKATCAPQYYRIVHQHGGAKGPQQSVDVLHSFTRGCLGGVAFCFVSHRGEVQPCGYLELPCGNVREMSFQQIWEQSEIFKKLRDPDQLNGKCGRCEFRMVCGGCRARAYTMTGDFLGEEPFCPYEPQTRASGN